MDNQQILEKAIKKAYKNGYDNGITRYMQKNGVTLKQAIEFHVDHVPENNIIFNHDFCKALWGGIRPENGFGQVEDWQYHLQQLVIADDVFKYLEEHAL